MRKFFSVLSVVFILANLILHFGPILKSTYAACGPFNTCHPIGNGKCGRGQVCGTCTDSIAPCTEHDDINEECPCPGADDDDDDDDDAPPPAPPPAAPTAAVAGAGTYEPLPCSTAPGLGNCPTDLKEIYKKEPCVTSYKDFMKNPLQNHYWALDEETTSQGKAIERARQFIYWAISRKSIDDHPIIRQIWGTTKNVALFLFILVFSFYSIIFLIIFTLH